MSQRAAGGRVAAALPAPASRRGGRHPAGPFPPRPSVIVAFVTASLSGIVILLHAFHWVTLLYTIRVLAPLTAFVYIALLVHARRGPEEVFLNRLAGGLIAGIAGLVAYDAVRLGFVLVHVPFNPFRPVEVFGLLILDRYRDTPITKAVGWAFHIWNSVAFALMYTLALGRGRMSWALAWSMVLEVSMLASYPSLFGIVRNWAFVSVTLAGHTGYGLAVGATARRVVKR